MSEFLIQVNQIDPQVQMLQACEKKLIGIAAEVRHISETLSIEGDSKSAVQAKLFVIAECIDERAQGTGQMADSLSDICRLYREADESVREIAPGA